MVWSLDNEWMFEAMDEQKYRTLVTDGLIKASRCDSSPQEEMASPEKSDLEKPSGANESWECAVRGCLQPDPESECTNCKQKCHFFCAHLTARETTCFECRPESVPFEMEINPSFSLATHFPAEVKIQTIVGVHPNSRETRLSDVEGDSAEDCRGEVCGSVVSSILQRYLARVYILCVN